MAVASIKRPRRRRQAGIELVDLATVHERDEVPVRIQQIRDAHPGLRAPDIVDHAYLSATLQRPREVGIERAVALEHQRWWKCPCRAACPYEVLYGKARRGRHLSITPATYYDPNPLHDHVCDKLLSSALTVVTVGTVADIDALYARLKAKGLGDQATLFAIWLELGLRDTLIAALAGFALQN